MCDPSSALFGATTALQLGGAILGSAGDADKYARQVKAIEDESAAINQSLIFRYKMEGMKEQQAQAKAAVDAGNELLKGEEAKGTATAAAATGGVEGNSVNQLLQSFDAATGHNLSTIYLNRDNEIAQAEMEKKAGQMDAQARLKGLKNNTPQDPGLATFGRFVQAGLGIGSSFIANTTKVDPASGQTGFLGRRFG